MDHKELQCCRVCGLFFPDFFPWGETGEYSSHEICECCGTEFGYEDCLLEAIQSYRKAWIDSGMKWFIPSLRPQIWDFEEQFKNIPDEFK
jgi:hypothetical protein